MNARTFSACLLLGWALATVGGVLIHPGAGLACSGLLLIALALLSARMAGGLYLPAVAADDDDATGAHPLTRHAGAAATKAHA